MMFWLFVHKDVGKKSLNKASTVLAKLTVAKFTSTFKL